MRRPVVLDFFRELRRTSGRFISIVLLILLSVGFFSGLRAAKPDMLATVDTYFRDYGLADIRIVSTLGLTEADAEYVRTVAGIRDAEGGHALDAIVRAPDADIIITMKTLGSRGINTPELIAGRLPERENECAAGSGFLSRMSLTLGGTFTVQTPDFEDALAVEEFTVVGVVRSPEYIDRVQYGVSTLGNGRISGYVLIKPSAVALEYYTELRAAVETDAAVYTRGYEDAADTVIGLLEQAAPERNAIRREELTGEYVTELQDAKQELADGRRELEDGWSEILDARAEYEDGVRELEETRSEVSAELEDALSRLEESARKIADGKRALTDGEIELERQIVEGVRELDAALMELESGEAALNEAWSEYGALRTGFEASAEQWNALPDAVKETMPETAAELDTARAELEAAFAGLTAQQAALDAGFAEYYEKRESFETGTKAARDELDVESTKLRDAETALADGYREYEAGKEDALRAISDAETELYDAWEKIADGERELRDAELTLADAEARIREAEEQIAEVPNGEWYVLGRETNQGYTGFRQDADRMGALADIFPVIFFAVAVLVCLTAMTRMVDEQRVEIGTFKALGLSKFVTSGKFIFYGLLAALIGIAVGLALGMTLIPRLIFHAYSILYDLPPLKTPMQHDTVLISFAAAIACTVGATVIACAAALRETPSSLLRPRAPVPGKRVFLELIPPLWKRFSFFAKVSSRNVLRYKKRLVMTITGIAGCTALVVTGLGLRDSILDLPSAQFGGIYSYDLLATINDDATELELESLYSALDRETGVVDYTFIHSTAVDFAGEGVYSGDLIVPQKPESLDGFITLRTLTGADIALGEGVVLTAKLAELLKLEAGDTVTLVSGGGRYTLPVSAVTEHYVYHYAYMSPKYYTQIFGGSYSANQMLVVCKDDTEETANAVSETLLNENAVGYLNHFKSAADAFEKSIGSINSVIVIIVLSAAALAFIVLFNLSSINITERRRELATIKVLGFYDSEVTWYIFRENTFLTLFGIAAGLVCGKYLHRWLITTVEVDFTRFMRTVTPMSYVFSALMTAAFAVIVNIIGHAAMKRINMVESLKINE